MYWNTNLVAPCPHRSKHSYILKYEPYRSLHTAFKAQLYTEIRTLSLPAHNCQRAALYWNTNLIAPCTQRSKRSYILKYEPYRSLQTTVKEQLYTEIWTWSLPAHNVQSAAIYWNTNLIAPCTQRSKRSYILKYEPYRSLHTTVKEQLCTEIRTLSLPAHNGQSAAIYWKTNLIGPCTQRSRNSYILK